MSTPTKRRKLGVSQVWMMEKIQADPLKGWSSTSKWAWDCPSASRKIAESLVKYGLLIKIHPDDAHPQRTKYVLTADGEKWRKSDERYASY